MVLGGITGLVNTSIYDVPSDTVQHISYNNCEIVVHDLASSLMSSREAMAGYQVRFRLSVLVSFVFSPSATVTLSRLLGGESPALRGEARCGDG